MRSRVPLTQSNLQYFAGVPQDQLNDWLDELLDTGVLDLNVSSKELEYIVPGSQRPANGPVTCEAYEDKRRLLEEAKRRIMAKRGGALIKSEAPPKKEVAMKKSKRRDDEYEDDDDGGSIVGTVGKAALMVSGKALVALDKPLSMLDKPRSENDKSLAISGAVSLLGPIGWFYAGSFREAVPATAAFAAAYYILPSVLLSPFIALGALTSGAVGVLYAWKFNRKKGRSTLFMRNKKKKKKQEEDDE